MEPHASRPKRRRRWPWVLLLTVVALAAATWFQRAPLAAFAGRTVARQVLDLDVALEGVEIDGLHAIRVATVRARPAGAPHTIRSATITGTVVEFELRDLLRRGLPALAIRAQAVDLDLDLSTAAGAADEAASGGARASLPAQLPALRVARLDVRARLSGQRALRLARGRLSLDHDGRIDVAAEEFDWNLGAGHRTTTLAAVARWDANVLEVEHLGLGSDLVLAPATVRFDAARIHADAVVEAAGGRARLSVRVEDGGDVELSGTLEGIDPGALLDLLGADAADWGGTWNAQGSLSLAGDDARPWTARARVDARAPRIAGRTLDHLSGSIAIDAARLDLADVDLVVGGNAVRVDLAHLPRALEGGCALLDRSTWMFRGDLGDVGGLLAALDVPDAGRELPPHRLEFAGSLAQGWVGLDRARLTFTGGEIDVAAAGFPIRDDPRSLFTDPALELEARVHCPDLAPLADLFLPRAAAAELDLRGRASGHARVRGTASGPLAVLDLRARDLVLRGAAFEEVDVRAELDAEALRVERLDARGPAGTFVVRGTVDRFPRAVRDLHVQGHARDIAAVAGALGIQAALPRGALDLEVSLSGPLDALAGEFALHGNDLVLGGVSIADLTVSGRSHADGIDLDDLSVLGADARLRLAARIRPGAADALRVCLQSVEVEGLDAIWSLARPCEIELRDGGGHVRDLVLAGAAGEVRADVQIDPAGGCAQIRVLQSRPAALLAALGITVPPDLRLEADLDTAWTLGTDGLRGPIDGSFDLHAPDLAPIDWPNGMRLSGALHAHGALRGSLEDPRAELDLLGTGLRATRPGSTQGVGPARVDARVELGPACTLRRFDVTLGPRSHFTFDGTLGRPDFLASIVRGGWPAAADVPLDLRASIDAADIAPLSFGIEALRRAEGALEGRVLVSGTLAEPRVHGPLRWHEGGLRVEAGLASIAGVDAALRFEGDTLHLDRFEGEFGGAPLLASGSARFSAEGLAADVRLRGKDLPLVRGAEVSVRGDADLTFTARPGDLSLAGTLELREALWTRRFDVWSLPAQLSTSSTGGGLSLPAVRTPPFDALRLDLAVRSNGALRVRSPLAQADLRLDLHVGGTAAYLEPDGDIQVEDGRVVLPASRLRLVGGRIDFNATDPALPRIDIRAEGRASGYDIQVRASGPFNDPLVEVSSVPSALQEDLLLLLLTGRAPGSGSLGVDEDRLVQGVASYLWRDVAYEWFGEAGESFADRLEIFTGAQVSREGRDTLEMRFRVTGDDRRARSAIYLVGERDVYDRENIGIRFVLRRR